MSYRSMFWLCFVAGLLSMVIDHDVMTGTFFVAALVCCVADDILKALGK